MKQIKSKKNKLITMLLCFTFFFISFMSLNSSKDILLIQNNVEAISETTRGGEPSGQLIIHKCYFSIKPKSGKEVKECARGTDDETDLPCCIVSNHTFYTDSETGYCWMIDPMLPADPLLD